jgi:methylated-DNA-[protein]-cysteine S-methyltransferase
MKLARVDLASPIGDLQVFCTDKAVAGLLFVERDRTSIERQFGAFEVEPAADALGIRGILERYFDGDIHALDVVPVEAQHGTPFQREVWAALRGIKPGETTTYGALAKRLGREGAQRAVGAANGANPIGIIVPCHRVIGHGSRLTGYGGGLDRKHWLLRHEGALLV